MHGPSHPLSLPDFPSLVGASLAVVIGIVLGWRCQTRLKEFHMGFSVCHSEAQFQSIGFHGVKAFTGADRVNNWPL